MAWLSKAKIWWESKIVCIKTDNISKEIAEDVEQDSQIWIMSWTDHYQKKKTIKLLKDDDSEVKRQKPQKGVIKKIKFVEYKHCLEESQLKNKINHVEKMRFL